MRNDTENIELRSEKVRNIIGQIPPGLIRKGSFIIFIIVFSLLIGSYFFKYPYTIKNEIIFKKRNNQIIGLIEVNANEINKLKVGHQVIVNFSNVPSMNEDYLVSTIDSIPNCITINSTKAYSNVYITPFDTLKTINGRLIFFENQIQGNALIKTDEISFFERIIQPLKSVLLSNRQSKED